MQAEGSQGRLILVDELTFKSPPEVVVEDCEDIWDEQTGTGITASLDAVDYKVGAGSCKLVEDGTSGLEILASEVIDSVDLDAYSHLVMWIKSTLALDAGDLQMLLDDTALCESPLETLDVPAIAADTWTQVKMAITTPAALLAVISVGIQQTVDKGALTLHLDDIRVINEAHLLTFNNESLNESIEIHSSNAIRSTRNPNQPARGNKSVDGDILVELDPFMGRILKHLFGSLVTTGADPYTHTFKIGSLPTGLMIEKAFQGLAQYFIYNGCRVNSWRMTVSPAGILESTFGIIGAKETIKTVSFDDNAVDQGHTPFDMFEATLKEGGSSLAYGSLVEILFENNLDPDSYVIGAQGERRYLPAGTVKVSGTLDVLFENLTIYNKAVNFTETSLEITLTKGTGDGSAGNEKLTLSLNEVKYGKNSPIIEGPKGVHVNLPFEAYYNNDADASALKAVLLNSQASY